MEIHRLILIWKIHFCFRFFMARKGILPRRKRGRASTASMDIDEPNQNRQSTAIDVETFNANKQNTEQS